eukprot:scaffold4850_cov213-Pinguiococcus_pyrenoidosus.AAC.6
MADIASRWCRCRSLAMAIAAETRFRGCLTFMVVNLAITCGVGRRVRNADVYFLLGLHEGSS